MFIHLCFNCVFCILTVIVVLLTSMARRAELQTTTRLRNVQDRIYFAGMNNWGLQALDRVTTERSDVDVQKSVEYKNRRHDQNFLQTIPTPGYPTTVKQKATDRQDLSHPYLQLQPALFLNDPHFYDNRYSDDIPAFLPTRPVPIQAPVQSKLPQAQPQLRPLKEQSQVFNQQVQPVRPSNSQTPDIQQNSQNLNSQNLGQSSQSSGHNVQIPLQIQTTQSPDSSAPVSRAVANFGLNILRVRL